MRETFFRRFGNGPFPFSVEKMDDYIEFYDSNELNVVITKGEAVFNQNDGYHSHDTYEFIIPSSPMPFTRVEDKVFQVKANNIFAINPQQIHGVTGDMRVKRIIGAHVDKEFLNEIANQLFGIRNFIFSNKPLIPNCETKQIMERFVQEAKAQQAGHKFILECLSTQMVINFLRLEKNFTEAEDKSHKTEISKSISNVIEFLRENYNSNTYSTKEIASIANLSCYHFIRTFKNETGRTPYEYLTDIKIEKARELLKTNIYSITEVCYMCGFTNQSSFSTTFKKKLGISPSEYRRK